MITQKLSISTPLEPIKRKICSSLPCKGWSPAPSLSVRRAALRRGACPRRCRCAPCVWSLRSPTLGSLPHLRHCGCRSARHATVTRGRRRPRHLSVTVGESARACTRQPPPDAVHARGVRSGAVCCALCGVARRRWSIGHALKTSD